MSTAVIPALAGATGVAPWVINTPYLGAAAGLAGGAALGGVQLASRYIRGRKNRRGNGTKGGFTSRIGKPRKGNRIYLRQKETKFNRHTSVANPTVGNWTEIPLCAVGQGVQQNQRIGNAIWNRGWKFRCVFDIESATSCAWRLIIATPRNSTAGAAQMPASEKEAVDPDLFQVHFDRFIDMCVRNTGDATYPVAHPPLRVLKKWLPYNYQIRYNDASTTPEGPVPRAFLGFIRYTGSVAQHPAMSYEITQYYTDS